MTVIYGIPNCDKCRKALKWFDGQNIRYRFHDVRKDGLDSAKVKGWLKRTDANDLLNRRSTTWRNLSAADRSVTGAQKVAHLLAQHPTLLKRPLVESKAALTVGYDEHAWEELYL
jgi:Spx/MgsR family transcriptional regulator